MDAQVECRRSGHIPAFGNWDYANDLPITQYFESARQAGLIRFCDHPNTTTTHTLVSSTKKRGSQLAGRRNNGSGNISSKLSAAPQFKEESKVVESQQEAQKKKKHVSANENKMKIICRKEKKSNSFRPESESEAVVDQDLYKIPPHLLHTSKRKKMLGFLSRCLGPGCTV